MAYAHDLPLFPVSSLAAIAYTAYQTESNTVLAVIDARMQQVYWGEFLGESFSVKEQVSSITDIVLTSKAPVIIAGVGFEPYVEQLPQDIQALIVKQCTMFPKAEAMIRLVQAGYIKSVSAAEALPVYVRNEVTHGIAKGEVGG